MIKQHNGTESAHCAQIKHSRFTILIFSFLSVMLLIGACSSNTSETTGNADVDKPVKIGVSMPLSGDVANLGKGTVDGIELALSEINAKGGIQGRPVEIVYEDDKCSKDGVTTLTKLVTVDNVDAIIGPFCSAAGGPGLPIVQQSGTPAVIYASAPHLTKIGDFIFRIYPSDSFAGKFMAEYVFNTMKKQTVAFVYVKNDWGQGLHDTFSQRFNELGGKIVVDEGLEQETNDVRTTVSKVLAAKPELVVAPLYPQGGLVFIKQMHEAGSSIQILGGDAFDDSAVYGSGIADGVLYTVASIKTPEDFKARLSALGKGTNIGTSLGYDSLKLYASVMNQVGTDKIAVRDALAKVHFNGISSSVIEFDENGDLNSAVYDVKLIKDKQSTKIN